MSENSNLSQRRKSNSPVPQPKRRAEDGDSLAAVEELIEAQRNRLGRPGEWPAYSVKCARIDYSALSPELAKKIRDRAATEQGSWPPDEALVDRMDPTRSLPEWLSWSGLGAYPALGLIFVTAYTAYDGMVPRALGLLMWAVLALLSLTSVGVHYWRSQGPLTLTGAESRQLRAHTPEIHFEVPPPHTGSVGGEPHAIQIVAVRMLADIHVSPAWRSEHCDLDRIQLDLVEEMKQIRQSCANLTTLDSVITETMPAGGATSMAREALKGKVGEYESLYREARAAVVRRVAALHDYRRRLAEIEALLDDLARTVKLAARTDDFTEAFTAIIRDNAAAERTEAMSADLELLRGRLAAELDFISGTVIHNPDLVTPLTVRPHHQGQA